MCNNNKIFFIIIYMKVLELFSGTKSVGKVCEKLGWEVISLDLLFDATHKINILDFDYKQYANDEFDIVWASPPCTQYSKIKTKGIRDIEGANKIVLKTLEIIKYFNPTSWYIENPQTGLLKDQEFMKGLPFVDADYCMYGMPYRKRTRIWTNKIVCPLLCDRRCGSWVNGKHIANIGNGDPFYNSVRISSKEAYIIPERLVFELLL